jgi:hypothetical protein
MDMILVFKRAYHVDPVHPVKSFIAIRNYFHDQTNCNHDRWR